MDDTTKLSREWESGDDDKCPDQCGHEHHEDDLKREEPKRVPVYVVFGPRAEKLEVGEAEVQKVGNRFLLVMDFPATPNMDAAFAFCSSIVIKKK